jgi:hypothetical protein
MKGLTFGICTDWSDPHRVHTMIASIRALDIPTYEIIVSGAWKSELDLLRGEKVDLYCYNEGWLPKKKNQIAKLAKFDTIVLAHDYYIFDKDWYNAYEEFGYKWDVCSNPQYLMNGRRHFTDWVLWDHPSLPRYTSLDYRDESNTKYQYLSGGYFLVKRHILNQYPMNERLEPGSAEDLEWFLPIRDKVKLRCNPNAKVIHNKEHRDMRRTGFPFVQESHTYAYVRDGKVEVAF